MIRMSNHFLEKLMLYNLGLYNATWKVQGRKLSEKCHSFQKKSVPIDGVVSGGETQKAINKRMRDIIKDFPSIQIPLEIQRWAYQDSSKIKCSFCDTFPKKDSFALQRMCKSRTWKDDFWEYHRRSSRYRRTWRLHWEQVNISDSWTYSHSGGTMSWTQEVVTDSHHSISWIVTISLRQRRTIGSCMPSEHHGVYVYIYIYIYIYIRKKGYLHSLSYHTIKEEQV